MRGGAAGVGPVAVRGEDRGVLEICPLTSLTASYLEWGWGCVKAESKYNIQQSTNVVSCPEFGQCCSV